MSQISKLTRAKSLKNDEFYTQYCDIEAELTNYTQYFKDKVIYCNCDNPYKSNFTRYFLDNLIPFGIKKLICTHIVPEGSKSIKLVAVPDKNLHISCEYSELVGNGDFKSEECVCLLKESDIIITNPPFSLFRDFLSMIMDYGKDMIVIGNKLAYQYSMVFNWIKNNKLRIGVTRPDFFLLEDSTLTSNLKGLCRWFTTFPISSGKSRLSEYLRDSVHKYAEGNYPEYDNYMGIEVSRIKEIPVDFMDIMGVPITYLDYHDSELYDILALAKRGGDAGPYKTKTYTKSDYVNASDLNASPVLIINGVPRNVYSRILIRKKSRG